MIKVTGFFDGKNRALSVHKITQNWKIWLDKNYKENRTITAIARVK